MLMGVKEIQEIIPHRHPFLLVDCIEELEPGVRAVGYKCVTYDESFFKGHFPQEPVMPGVLLIEALAQTGARKEWLIRWRIPGYSVFRPKQENDGSLLGE